MILTFFFRILNSGRPGQTASLLQYEPVKLKEHRKISPILSYFEFSTFPFF